MRYLFYQFFGFLLILTALDWDPKDWLGICLDFFIFCSGIIVLNRAIHGEFLHKMQKDGYIMVKITKETNNGTGT